MLLVIFYSPQVFCSLVEMIILQNQGQHQSIIDVAELRAAEWISSYGVEQLLRNSNLFSSLLLKTLRGTSWSGEMNITTYACLLIRFRFHL